MSRKALGLIETLGLAAGVQAADAAVKAANVSLIGYELTKGGGLVTVKVEGDVGAVQAAVAAGVAAAEKINQVWSQLVIPRPQQQLDSLIISQETVGLAQTIAQSEKPAVTWSLAELRELMGFQPKKGG